MPNNNRLPPLESLATFEVAARLLSFTLAAEERFVTQSAVSRQIRALEEDLGVTLFVRGHRSLTLTEAGERLHVACQQGLQKIREGVARVRSQTGRRQIVVTTTPGLASLWLIPRLAGFTRGHPGVDVRLDAVFARRDLEAEGIDIAIRYGDARTSPGVKLLDEEVMPVCSPACANLPGRPLREPGDLARHTLIRLDEHQGGGPLQDWQPWLVAMGVPELQPAAVLTFSNYDDVIGAAVHGQGIAMGRRPLIDGLLAEGKLVMPLKAELASSRAFFVIVAPSSAARPEVRAFEQWLSAGAPGS
ncbi:MAG TPA: LysR substrate-binding domain-containing protein [Burkholderiaceae bacterium]|jgi:DNA-binding transcriptional LysR family regulator|nr:LysR substrate-binding domain-containing protein [Burkholderiaceae bacterium]